ncbi:CehA/McbA family metallohydrolase [Roseiconus lacunae]|uniref:CehA/McbA family metallohydrolase n=1 Tax=Roseiconus lacunae TaxID=2605694 RepID=UPI00308972F5|nr:CehA/McbA family metallohydrolase [Stieleria sp. HD01]
MSTERFMLRRQLETTFAVAILLVISGCSEGDRQSGPDDKNAAFKVESVQEDQPAILNRIPWIGKGHWLKVDTHAHTTFSDGKFPIIAVVESARNHGCDVIAITDHASHDLGAATEQYFAQIRAAQKQFPEIEIIPGLEWNVPPYDGDEHVTVLTNPGNDAWLRQFKEDFDGYENTEVPPALEALRWVDKTADGEAVLLLNHPSRKRVDPKSIVVDMVNWQSDSQSFIGFAGAPGHQNKAEVGSYLGKLTTIDRWDPATERIGGGWDQLLGSGHRIFAALAPSDFHSPAYGDYWPGEFSETWVYSPDRSAGGTLQALKAGSFFANHGGIAQHVVLSVECQGLERPVQPGETLIAAGKPVDVLLEMQIPELDLQGNANSIDEIELIAIVDGDASIIAKSTPKGTQTPLLQNFQVPSAGVVFRARGRRVVTDGPDLMFYTNPVWVLASSKS